MDAVVTRRNEHQLILHHRPIQEITEWSVPGWLGTPWPAGTLANIGEGFFDMLTKALARTIRADV
jgi:hypothetical protein